jgi:hypothetical protein
MRIFLPVLATLALSAGCYHQGDVGVGYSYGYAAPAPDLYYVGPGVSVVAYSDHPVFYADNYYWRYDGGIWYRSGYYNGGWIVAYDVPYNVRRIDRPHTYARFQPGAGWSRAPAPGYQGAYRGGVRDHRSTSNPPPARYAPPATRDHRPPQTYTPSPQPTYTAPAPAPATRDHRAPQTYTPSPQPTHRAPPPSSAPATRDHRRR